MMKLRGKLLVKDTLNTIKKIKYYTGIGSRTPPENILKQMIKFSSELSELGYVLRSGAADGSDAGFEVYAEDKEIYLPWKKFNEHTSPHFVKSFSKEIQERQKELARKYHPAFDDLSYGASCMMRRNMHQVLGLDLNTPSDLLICWTHNGKDVGGTGTAMRCAKDHGVPIFNLHSDSDYEDLKRWILMESFIDEN